MRLLSLFAYSVRYFFFFKVDEKRQQVFNIPKFKFIIDGKKREFGLVLLLVIFSILTPRNKVCVWCRDLCVCIINNNNHCCGHRCRCRSRVMTYFIII